MSFTLAYRAALRAAGTSAARGFATARAGAKPAASSPALRIGAGGMLAMGTAAVFGVTTLPLTTSCEMKTEQHDPTQVSTAGQVKKGLPEYSRKQVAEHTNAKKRIWVTYLDGVYDITDFAEAHPGGKKIMLAAGGSIEPYWALYGVHKSEATFNILETLRVGNIIEADRRVPEVGEDKGPYATDPERNPSFIFLNKMPCNAEPPNPLLADEYYTKNEVFFVRNHLPVPVVDPKKYRLIIEGIGISGGRKEVSLEDLKTKFKKVEVTATLQCAGNRRTTMQDMPDGKHAKGLAWQCGAISNAKWGGASLREVLLWAGVKEDEIEHVHFEGLDGDTESGYTSSIPAIKALGKYGDCVLAYEMNGVEIPRDHGYPIRAVAPGIVAARSVKWLAKVVANKVEGNGQFMVQDYKVFNSSVDWSNVNWSKAPAMQDLPVTSAILEPAPGTYLEHDVADTVTIKGFAWSGGGRGIQRVDISVDGGKEWVDANLLFRELKQPYGREWAWTLWEAEVPVPKATKDGKFEVICKATDSAANTQPERPESIWNIRGVAVNSWHRVQYEVPKEGWQKADVAKGVGAVAAAAAVAAAVLGAVGRN